MTRELDAISAEMLEALKIAEPYVELAHTLALPSKPIARQIWQKLV